MYIKEIFLLFEWVNVPHRSGLQSIFGYVAFVQGLN